ncbi:MAG: efflux RND transporter permease subunit [Verrucomicrobia bacterium]|nr:efflux RND transporter permease subunit [Verrucomicrobiota bacterium]MDA1085545.1 efflux RND transporter permease subunit [Verrucomicrobiota bacterium]
MSIAEFSVKNSIIAWMATLIVVVGGLMAALFTMQREVFPVTDLDLAVIRTFYPNASPAEVEDQVTNLIEDELTDITGIDEYSSSSSEGVSVIIVQLDADVADTFRVVNDIQRHVDQIDDFPDEVEDPVIESITTDQPLINVCVAGSAPERELRRYGDELERRLRRIPGVSSIDKQGWRDEEFWVEADPGLLHDFEVSLNELIIALRESNVTLPGGKIESGAREIILRTVGKFHSEAEIEKVVVRSNIDGRAITVKDVAQVRRMFEEDAVYTKANGELTLILGVKKKESGDTIDIADAVKELVKAETASLPDGVRLTLIDDSSYYVKRRLRVLLNNGGIGLILVLACLFVALNFRVAVFTALGIPFAFLGTLLIMSYFGMTINLMTMFGLIIVLGMIVDDTIIVGENIYRHLEEGKPPRQAAIDGAKEVTGPVISTVLTTIAAFFPLMFAPDLYATYLGWLVLTVIVCLVASLVECLFIMPSHLADFAKPLEVPKPDGEAANPPPFRKAYLTLLEHALRWRYFVLPGVVIFAALVMLAIMPYVRVILFPGDMIDIVFVYMSAAEGTSIDTTEELAQQVESVVAELPESDLTDYVTYVGQQLDFEAGMGRIRGSHYAQIAIYLTPQDTRKRKTQEIINQLRERSAEIKGLERLSFEMVKPGPPVGKPLEVRIQGRDIETLKAIAKEVKAYLVEQEGVSDVEDDYGAGKDERHVIVDERQAARLGLSVKSVAETVFAAYEGAKATAVREGKDELEVRVMLQKEFRDDETYVKKLQVLNRAGRLIPIEHVADLVASQGLPTLNHFDGERVITVGAEIDEEVVTSAAVNTALEKHFKDLPVRYEGYRLLRGGEWAETRKVMLFMVTALAVALLLMYTILAVQFGSFFQPLVLLFPIPLSFVGVIAALILHGKPISIMAMLGFVGLGGVVVNDAIVLVSFINSQRARGVSLHDALMIGGEMRLRPIFLTSITTILGLLPVIYGIGGYEPFIAPAAIVLAFGLFFATYLTLVIVPVIYHIGADMKGLFRVTAQPVDPVQI